MTSKLTKTGLNTRGPNRSIAWCCILLALVATRPATHAAPLEEARVSRVVQDVRLLASNAAPRPAAVNDAVKQGAAVRTGTESRAELTFSDQTITRLGQNTVFSINGGTREVSLDSGAMLLQVPHGGEPAQIRTAAVTASISGGTALFSANKGYPKKLLVMEGIGKLCLQGTGDCEIARGGEMLTEENGQLSKPVKFNAKLVFTTAHLLTDFPPLANEDLILQVINQQEEAQPEGPPPPNQDDTIDETDQRAAASPTPSASESPTPTPTPTPSITPTPTPSVTPTPTPTPSSTPTPTPSATPTPSSTPTPTPGATPSKFGTPSTITSPNPYVIDSGTVISTDPAITTNGVTDYGKIYRGAEIDGAFSAWAFGSTSAFDTSSGFDAQIGNGSDPGGAGFKFTSLVLAGDPTIITEGGEDDLGLIAVDGITSAAPGGVLTFSGIRGLLLATVNGPITLGPEVSFSGLHDLTLYARGATSDLTLGSEVDTMSKVHLYAEHDVIATSDITTETFSAVAGRDISLATQGSSAIQAVTISMFAGHDLNLNGFVSSATAEGSTGDVSLLANHDIFSTGGIYITRQNGGISSGLNLRIDAQGNDITIGQGVGEKAFTGLTLIVNNNDTELESGGNITVNAGSNLTIQDGGSLQLSIENTDGARIGEGGNISLTTGGDVMAGSSFEANIDSTDGQIDDGGNIDVEIGGSLTTGSVSMQGYFVSGLSQGPGENLTLRVGSNLTASNGGIDLEITTPVQQVISAGANLTLDVTGNLMTDPNSSTFLFVNNNINEVTSGANISATIGGSLTTGALQAELDNVSGTIGTGGNISINVTGDLDTVAVGGVAVPIRFNKVTGDSLAGELGPGDLAIILQNSGGQIDSTAKIEVTAANLSADGFLDAGIFNYSNGSIGEDARILFDVPGDMTIGQDASFVIDNSNGGTIGGDARIDLMSAPNVSIDGNLDFLILNNSGSIGGNAVIDVVANSIVVGGDLNAYIDNTNGSIGGGLSSTPSPFGGANNGSLTLESFGAITVTGRLNVLGTVLADDDVNVGTLSVTHLDTQGNNLIVGAGGITRFSFPGQPAPDILHTLDVRLISSTGGINFDGVPADGDFSAATDGGDLTINALVISFGPTGNIMGKVSFNGGDASSTFGPGSGGTFTVNATSNITVDSDIEATTGYQDSSASPGGDGGTVTLNSTSGTVTVDNRIEVSSNDQPAFSPSGSFPVRRSAAGGNINLTSGKTSGVAINISNTAQLLALLDGAAPGPGGKITLLASRPGSNGSNSSSIEIDNANGVQPAIAADGGTVEIRHEGDFGMINIANANIAADIVKIGALGTNGTLNIGSGTISADTTLKLYANGSNGIVNFNADVTLSGASAKIIAGGTINILDGVTVHIDAVNPVAIYVNSTEGVPNANYTGFGGNGSTTGTFDGGGASAPQPLENAPLFGDDPITTRHSRASATQSRGSSVSREKILPLNQNDRGSAHVRLEMPNGSMPVHP